jgi:C1A family cysteine protease
MKKIIYVLLAVSILMSFTYFSGVINAGETKKIFDDVKKGPYSLGLKLDNKDFKKLPANLKRDTSNLPSSVDLSSKMPPVGNQGDLGSCTAWASGYYYKSYQESKDWHWTPNSTSRTFSPKYIYNQVNGGVDGGAYISSVFSLLQNQGVCTWAKMPYDTDYWTQPDSSQTAEASKYKASGIYSLGEGTYWGGNGNIQNMKAWLASGDAVVIAIPVCDDFMYINQYGHDDVYDNVAGSYYGNHALCVVGYGPKGFKIINSWGTGWGNSGYAYISYDMMSTYAYDQWAMIDDITPTYVKWNGYSKPSPNNPVGTNWSVSVKVGGKSISYGKALTTEASSYSIKIIEDDGASKYDDIGYATGTLKFGQNKIKVWVKENNGKYKGKSTYWYIDIYRQ